MKIVVTQECIDRGKKNNDCECPIALAAKAMGHARVSVEADRIFLGCDWTSGKSMALPDSARLFIDDYDEGRPVEPFEFELPVEGP